MLDRLDFLRKSVYYKKVAQATLSYEGKIMQSKYIKMLSDEQRVCSACGYEDSPNGGKQDDLRWFDNVSGPWHPICKDEVDNLFAEFNKNNTPRETAIHIFQTLGIDLSVMGINGKQASELVSK
jgi:hypothetical protein